ncbi:DUF1624 domain-containing protein [Acinetobacter sp. S40]|uniref:DUF1624 domain-containing protein n=1 Tax=Acinetobacter sp. S40 TaxID=2767434 RepID=UPI00190B29DD|nr:heparan-alpha-glucosaminide N-acetyltransferase domain-containing protein [Acinetobacter sp. S40]MBJ9985672.1 DUF1624 domain-containing protein [Acinetobacter sp. S40]
MSKARIIPRLQSIDALRGLVIIIMLLDHVRETFYLHKQVSDPMNVAETEPALFWSRVLAHLCAPVFVLLTGMSAFLFQLKTQSIKQTRLFLLKRGLFLILLELTLVNFAWTAAFPPDVIYLQVIWAIGLSMVVLSMCIGIPKKILLSIGLFIIMGHNLLDNISFKDIPILEHAWLILHERGWIELELLRVRTSYPVLPWIGVILIGYCLGQFFEPKFSSQQRDRYLLCIGFFSILLFVVLRWINVYGDQTWQRYDSAMLSVMSFFNLTKYPPSLLFILWNVGIGLILLIVFERLIQTRFLKTLVVFGSVPMFFYLLHLYVLKLLYVVCVMFWGTTQAGYFAVSSVSELWLITLLLTLVLYPVVKAFSTYKHANKQITWLKYF